MSQNPRELDAHELVATCFDEQSGRNADEMARERLERARNAAKQVKTGEAS